MEYFCREEARKILEKEQLARKHIRRLQVRQQFQAWSERHRKRAQEEKEIHFRRLHQECTEKERESSLENIQKLILMHELTVQAIGTAHRAAQSMPNYQKMAEEREEVNQAKARIRGSNALKKEREVADEKARVAKAAQSIREKVRVQEDLKAKDLVEKMPFRQRNPSADLKSGKFSKDDNIVYNEHLVRLLNAPGSEIKKPPPPKVPISILKKPKPTPAPLKPKPGLFASLATSQISRSQISRSPHLKNVPKSKRKRHNYVLFYDDSIPSEPQLAREPKGLVRKDKQSPGGMSAWEAGEELTLERQRVQREAEQKLLERQRLAEERGRSALALAKLQGRLNEYLNELDDIQNLKEGLQEESELTEDEIEELFSGRKYSLDLSASGISAPEAPESITGYLSPRPRSSSMVTSLTGTLSVDERSWDDYQKEILGGEGGDGTLVPLDDEKTLKELEELDEIQEKLDLIQEPPIQHHPEPSGGTQTDGTALKVKSKERKSFREYLLDRNFNESLSKHSLESPSASLSSKSASKSTKPSTTDYFSPPNSNQSPMLPEKAYPETSTPIKDVEIIPGNEKLEKYIEKLLRMRPESVQCLSGTPSSSSSNGHVTLASSGGVIEDDISKTASYSTKNTSSSHMTMSTITSSEYETEDSSSSYVVHLKDLKIKF